MFFKKPKLLIMCSILILVLLSGMVSVPPVKSSFDGPPEIRISTPPYPIGMDSKESKRVPYTFKTSDNFAGEITSRVFQFYTQYDEPLSDVLGPYPTRISINSLQPSKRNELVYLPESVVNKARALDEYAIVLKTTFFGVSASGEDFHAEASLLLLLPPSSFSKTTPANRATNQPFQLFLQWNSTVGAIDYEYCLDTINNNACDTGWIGTYEVQAKLRDLSPSTTFYWQVRANNTAGTTYANGSSWWSFRTCSQNFITVANSNDTGAGSLRQAIADICSGGTIKFASSLSGLTITLASPLKISKDLIIDGSELASKITLSGNHQYRIFEIQTPAQVTIDNLQLVNASSVSGGAAYNTGNLSIRNSIFSDNAASNGAAVYNEGSLNLTNTVFLRNSAVNQGGSIFNSANASLNIIDSSFVQNSALEGGAIITMAGSQTTITGSLFANNTAASIGGGILLVPGTVSIKNSTFFANQASAGGGISNSNGRLTVKNSTFSENEATAGGGIANTGFLTLTNTILANSVGASDCLNIGFINATVSNLVETNDCAIPVQTSLDPNLGPLADNGGPTQTLALLPGSPAIDAGNNLSCTATDQRGVSRPQGFGCDIGAYEANGSVNVRLGAGEEDSYNMAPGQIRRVNYAGVNQGPVQIRSTNAHPILAAERIIYKTNNVPTSFSEMMALPNSQLDTIYWLPWYNNKDLDTQLRFANVSNTTATVRVFIGGKEMGTGFSLAAGESTRKSFAGINNGPVLIVSDHGVPIVAAERVIYKVNGVNTSFSEMMALPNRQLDTTYWLPWYNNATADLDTQLRIANVSNTSATVRIFIGGQEVGTPFTLAVGESVRKSFAGINNGPVKIVSNRTIVVAERVLYKVNGVNTSFTEMMALPNNQLDTMYWFPWYNNKDLDTQLRFANTSGATALVHVFIGNEEVQGSPFSLAAGASIRKSFPGINSGPVKIMSTVPIVAAERVIYNVNGVNTSFSELLGIPNHLLDTTYWLPWYNNVDLDTQLRFGMP